MKYFEYGEKELNYLKSKDKALKEAIERIGMIKREVYSDLFTALVYNIIGQQISMKAVETIWSRILNRFGTVSPGVIHQISNEVLQSVGITMKKAKYIKSIAEKIVDGSFNLDLLHDLNDEEVIKRLTELDGVGVWTAEMLMLFSLERKNILSWSDLAIRRGMMLLYHHRNLDKIKFERYKKRYSPYGSIASLYLWEISIGK